MTLLQQITKWATTTNLSISEYAELLKILRDNKLIEELQQ